MRVFISYSRKDVDAANALSAWLEARGADVFIDYQEILGTDHFPERLAREIDACDVLLLLLSEPSMASRWVLREVEYADEQQKSVVIVRLDETSLPKALFYLSRREHLDGRELLRTTRLSPALQDKLARTLGLPGSAPAAPAPQVSVAQPAGSAKVETNADGSPPASAGRSRFMGGIAVGFLLVGVLAVALLLLTRRQDPGPFDLTPIVPVVSNETVLAFGNMTATQSAALLNATHTIDALTTVAAEATTTPTDLLPTPPPTPTPTPSETPTAAATTEAPTSEPTAEATPDAAIALLESQVSLLDSQTMAINWEPQWEPHNGVDMAKIPAGCFEMGGSPLPDLPSDSEVFIICVEAFWLDRYEVSNDQFASMGGVSNQPSYDDVPEHPRTNLSWEEARDYCAQRGTRLPTEAEWEYAARGPFSNDYPWDDEFDSAYANDDGQGLVAVDEFGDALSWTGVYNMAGNAAEWTSSRMRGYPYDAEDGREAEPADESDLRVLRGGAFETFNLPEFLSAATRISALSNRDAALYIFGVRCARDAE